MRRSTLYSSAPRKPRPVPVPAAPAGKRPAFSWRDFYQRRRNAMLTVFTLAFVVLFATLGMTPPVPALTQADLDAAVARALKEKTLPSPAAKAYAAVRASVVRVRAGADSLEQDEYDERAAGSGVVVVESGIILTNLHVVAHAERVTVTFYDGFESEADLVSVHPENDLAVIKARKIPDDLVPATLGSASRLKPGDEVVAVGFPFGIGPSVSAGVVSGLNREFRSPEGDRVLTRLIQFDAAANPGSSGGPLVTMQGDVVGIVTAILSPNEGRGFVGIGFAVTIAAAGGALGMHPF